MARPPLGLGTYGEINIAAVNGRHRARARYRDSDGRTRVVERWGPSAAAATRDLKAALLGRQHGEGGAELTAESTVAALLRVWWPLKQQKKRNLSAGTKASYEDIMVRILIPGLGEIRIREATTKKLDSWLIKQQQRRPAQADLARTILRQAFDLAAQWDLLASNPARAVSTFEKDIKEPRGLTLDELSRWRDQLRQVRHNLWIADVSETQLGLGLRIGETLALRADALDLDNPAGPRVLIHATVITPHGQPHALQPHTKEGPAGRRTIVAPDWVAAILARRALLVGPSGLIFASRNDTLLNPHNVREAWRRERGRAGLDWLVPHNLRKTALSCIEEAYGLETAQAFADHASPLVTKTHYITARTKVGPDVRPALNRLAPTKPR